MNRWRYIALFTLIAVCAYLMHLNFRAPPGMEPLGGNEEMVAKLSLWTAIAGAIAGFFSLLKEIVGMFEKGKDG